jgi:hypothetical protein
MPHYRTMLSNDNFCAADLWSEQRGGYGEIIVGIEAVKKGEVVGEGGRKKGMPFITMRSAKNGQVIPKPLGLNATNCKTIASLAGSADVSKWIGKWITLYVTKTTVGRETVDAIRIRPELAPPPVQAGKQGPPPGVTPPPVQEPAFDPSDVQREDHNA